jgi:chorismate dehydratase
MPINVARIPNLECEAFYFDMERRGIELRNMEPNAVAEALEQGEIDAGPVSLVDTFRLAPKAVPISGFCVASVARATSSVLLSKAPIEALSGGRIALGDGDATSVSLLQALLTLKHEVRREVFVDQQSDHDAVLLTGNQALRGRRRARGFPHRYDLGEEWQAWTGLPFVFSRWMASSEMERRDFVLLEDALFVGQDDWINNLYRATGPRDDLLMLPREVLEYVQGLRFFIGVPEERAIALFQEKMALLDDPSA